MQTHYVAMPASNEGQSDEGQVVVAPPGGATVPAAVSQPATQPVSGSTTTNTTQIEGKPDPKPVPGPTSTTATTTTTTSTASAGNQISSGIYSPAASAAESARLQANEEKRRDNRPGQSGSGGSDAPLLIFDDSPAYVAVHGAKLAAGAARDIGNASVGVAHHVASVADHVGSASVGVVRDSASAANNLLAHSSAMGDCCSAIGNCCGSTMECIGVCCTECVGPSFVCLAKTVGYILASPCYCLAALGGD